MSGQLIVAFVVALLVAIVAPPILAVLNEHHRVPLWLAFLLVGFAALIGLTVGASLERERPGAARAEVERLEAQIGALEAETDRYDAYAEHLRQVSTTFSKLSQGRSRG